MTFDRDTVLIACALWLFGLPALAFAAILFGGRGSRGGQAQVRGARGEPHSVAPPPPRSFDYDPHSPQGRIAEHSGNVVYLTDRDAS